MDRKEVIKAMADIYNQQPIGSSVDDFCGKLYDILTTDGIGSTYSGLKLVETPDLEMLYAHLDDMWVTLNKVYTSENYPKSLGKEGEPK